jgi:flavodoxin
VNVLVVYDTQYGNTASIAGAIATGLQGLGDVRLAPISEVAPAEVEGVDLLVIGGPTEGHTFRQPLGDWLRHVPDSALDGLRVATFDTHVAWPGFLAGSAARMLAKRLRRREVRMVVQPESFLLSGTKGPIKEGEIPRAQAWAMTLAAQLAARPVARR